MDMELLAGIPDWWVWCAASAAGVVALAEQVSGDGWVARVFLGSLLGSSSPVRTYSPLLGAELRAGGEGEQTRTRQRGGRHQAPPHARSPRGARRAHPGTVGSPTEPPHRATGRQRGRSRRTPASARPRTRSA